MEQENKMTIEEASVNLDCVKEEFEFAENQYKVASTYENIFGETLEERRNNLGSLIGFLDDDIIMTTETGTIKLEDVEEENIEECQSEIIQCDCCKVWLEKDEHLESHMLHCLENYNILSHNLRGSRSTNISGKGKVRGSDDVDASHSIPSTEIIDSKRSFGIDCRAYGKNHFHGDDIGTTHSECFDQTNRKKHLKRHLNTRNDIKAFECDICKKGFTRKVSLKMHIKKKHTSGACVKDYKCSECSYQTNHKGNLQVHLNKHKGIKPFQCDICAMKFSMKQHLKTHIKNRHTDVRDVRDYKCLECSFQTNYKSHIQSHLNQHTGIRPFTCDICAMKYTRKEHLARHIRNKHTNDGGVKDYKCSECFYQTNCKRDFQRHLNKHKGIKPFKCNICAMKFPLKYSLTKHIENLHATNASAKDYKCLECTFQTNFKTNFQMHLNKHKDIKEFQCAICMMKFTRKDQLKLHIRNKHTNDGGVKDYKCLECSYQTNNKSHFHTHLNKHRGITFTCDICMKEFSQKGNLARHINTKHAKG